ncbi:MAG: NAD(P)/FAD-dependent oxidoreductase [Alphaproteobacteria bacterium]|nr:NAD(P)/FAD-dependent oxidoreductase [Alphaproteobacteria bacterium]
MTAIRVEAANTHDVIVVGGGHNGLVAAAYLARAGRKVAVLEARDRMGGACATTEFIPGYRVSYPNSPGSLEPRVVADLELERFGLRFFRPELTVVHGFPDRCFIGWRDRARVDRQLDSLAEGESGRYHGLLAELEAFAADLGVSLFEPPPDLVTLAQRMKTPAQKRMFERVFNGSLAELLDGALRSHEAKALLGMVATAGNLTPISMPGSAMGLMLRPLSLASSPAGAGDAHDPRRTALRGSTGLAIGGMGAIVDALVAVLRSHAATLRTEVPVARVLHRDGRVCGVATRAGEEFTAPVVISALSPKLLFRDLLDDAAVGADLRREIAGLRIRGSAFKIALALDGLPSYRGLPDDLPSTVAATTQFRMGASLDWIESSIVDALSGVPSRNPIIWGLIPSATSPGLAPEGRHLMSINLFHAPYELREGSWDTERDRFGKHCIDVLTEMMPDLPDRIVATRFMAPPEIETDLGMVEGNITHGDMQPRLLFGARPHRAVSDYRTPLRGLYLSGAGTWPGGYVTGVPGHNSAHAVLADQIRN